MDPTTNASLHQGEEKEKKVLDLKKLKLRVSRPQPSSSSTNLPQITISPASNTNSNANMSSPSSSDLSVLSRTPSPAARSARSAMIRERQLAPRKLDDMTTSQLTASSNRLQKHEMSNAQALARLQILVKKAEELKVRCKEIEDEKKRRLGFAVEGDEKVDENAVKAPPPSMTEGNEEVKSEMVAVDGEIDTSMMSAAAVSDYGDAVTKASSPNPSIASTSTSQAKGRTLPKTSTSNLITAKPARNSKRPTAAKRSLAAKQKAEADAAALAHKQKLEADEKAFRATKFKVTKKEFEEYQRLDEDIKATAGEIKELEAYLVKGKWTGREKWAGKIVERNIVEDGLLAVDEDEEDKLPSQEESSIEVTVGKEVTEDVEVATALTPTTAEKKVKGMAKKGGKQLLVPRSPQTGDMSLVPLDGEEEGVEKVADAIDYS